MERHSPKNLSSLQINFLIKLLIQVTYQQQKKKVADSLTKSIVEIIDTPEYPCKPEVVQIIFNDIKRSNVSRAGIIQG